MIKRNIRHIRARNDEWVQVHRDAAPAPAPSYDGSDWWFVLLLKVGGGILAFWLVCTIIKAMLPFLVLGALGWFFLKFHGK